MPEVFVFLLEQRSISRLALFSDEPGLRKIEPREALPFDEEYQKFQNVNVELMSLSKGSSDSEKP